MHRGLQLNHLLVELLLQTVQLLSTGEDVRLGGGGGGRGRRRGREEKEERGRRSKVHARGAVLFGVLLTMSALM